MKAGKAVVLSVVVSVLSIAMAWKASGEIANTMHGFAMPRQMTEMPGGRPSSFDT